MSVIYTRTGIPKGGKQAEALNYFRGRAAAIQKLYGVDCGVKVRAGGPVGQVLLSARLNNLGHFEEVKRRVIADTVAGKVPVAPDGVFASGEDGLWMDA